MEYKWYMKIKPVRRDEINITLEFLLNVSAIIKVVSMGAASLLFHHAKSLFFIMAFMFSILITNSVAAVVAKEPRRLVTKLIHHDSILSPFYNASATSSDRATRAIERSKARLAYLKAATTRYSLDDIRSGLVQNGIGTVFYVNISIGQPPVPQLVVMDTGSSIFWIHCPPCVGTCGSARSPTPMFDPNKSSSYSPYPCPCAELGPCDFIKNQCLYTIDYGGGKIRITGNYALEDLTFVTFDEKATTISNMLFGCGHAVENFSDEQARGVLGLGAGPTSVTKQIGSRFSYCIGNISNPEDTDGQLIIGDKAIIDGNLTQLDVYKGFYYLTLQGISFGDKPLDIDPKIFQRNREGRGGVIIDSGMTLTILDELAFGPLKNEVQNFIDGLNLEHHSTELLPLCYKGFVSQDLIDFPAVTFHFAGGADLVLGTENLFLSHIPAYGSFCLAVTKVNRNNTARGASMIGVIMQQYLNVGYDLLAKKLSFMPLNCAFLYS
ncbi:hypothetical protein RJ640_004962 [Escallonia rubra]|uniref:Peptidase A1 domain-containing protein n=1 Tax=Escallonia rubra TaxID=112253 RepID=A0AA88UE81_9ASTE|nr:hypothetical protein RJ640_004962 [Escallonia rubra]